VADIRVPAGMIVCTVMRHDSVSERHFPQPLAFIPERWLGEQATGQGPASAKRVSMPFGGGPRICPGRYLALIEMKLALAMLLGRFDIQRVDTPDGGEAQEYATMAMAPVGLRMILRERAGR
jgi:cytochrome P450